MAKIGITPDDVIKIVEGAINFMQITLLGEPLGPDADMEREENVTRLEKLIEKLNCLKETGFVVQPPIQKQRSTKIWKSEKKEKPPVKRSESTVGDSSQKETKESPKIKPKEESLPLQEAKPPLPVPVEADYFRHIEVGDTPLIDDEEYEVPSTGYPADAGDVTYNSLSYEQLKERVKSLDRYSPTELKEKATFAGVLWKHKQKKVFSKWHKRYCVLCDDFLFYFKSEADINNKGRIILPGYSLVVPPKEKSFLFTLESVDKSQDSYTFQADRKEDFNLWKKHISMITNKALSSEDRDVLNKFAKEQPTLDEDAVFPGSLSNENEAFDDPTSPEASQEIYNDVADGFMPQRPTHSSPGENSAQPPADSLLADSEQGEMYEFIPGQQSQISPETLPFNAPIHSPTFTPPPVHSPTVEEKFPAYRPPRPSTSHLPIGPQVLPRIVDSSLSSSVSQSPGRDRFSSDHIYVGMYDCHGDDADDLTFNRGDILYKIDEIDMNWWIGYSNGKVGLVPSNFFTSAFK